MAYLLELRANGLRILLDRTQILGRDPTCDVVLDDPKISRRHATIQRTSGGAYRIKDLGSRAGVFVNGQAVDDHELQDGDELRLGQTRLRVMTRVSITPLATPLATESHSAFGPGALLGDAQQLRRDYDRLRAAHRAHIAVGVEQRPEKIAERILDAAFEVLPAQRGVVALFEPGTTQTAIKVTRVRDGVDAQVALSQTLVDYVVQDRRSVIFSDAVEDERLRNSRSVHAAGMRSLICVPLVHDEVMTGLIQLDSPYETHVFHDGDLELLNMVGQSAALAFANVMLRHSLNDLRERERLRLLHILNVLPTGLVLISGEGVVVGHNPAGHHALQRLAAFDGERLTHLAGQALQDILQLPEQVLIDHRVGSEVYSISAQVSPNDSSHSAVLILQDVTKVRREQEQAARTDRLAVAGRVASGLAHDFNNLLTVINEGAAYIMGTTSGPDVITEASAIREAGQRAAALVRQLLTFSRQDPTETEPLDLSAEIAQMGDLLTRALGASHQLELDLAPDLPAVNIDPSHVQQLVMNLVVNAKDAMTTPGHVRIRTRLHATGEQGHAGVLVEVQDDGAGIPPEIQGRIFEPFFSAKPFGQGTGLGLATVYGIVERVGGQISVHSEINRGARFEIILPAYVCRTEDMAIPTRRS